MHKLVLVHWSIAWLVRRLAGWLANHSYPSRHPKPGGGLAIGTCIYILRGASAHEMTRIFCEMMHKSPEGGMFTKVYCKQDMTSNDDKIDHDHNHDGGSHDDDDYDQDDGGPKTRV